MQIQFLLLRFFCLGLASPLCAQSFFQPLTGPYHGAAAYADSVTDIAATFLQPAALARTRQTTLACRGERRYGLAALSQYQGMLALPLGAGAAGIQWSRAGDAFYRESGFALLYGRRLGAVAEAGVRFQYQYLFMQGYGGRGMTTADAGLVMQAGPDWRAGLAILQLGAARTDSLGKFFLPATLQLGTGYRFSPQLHAVLLVEKTRQQPVLVHTTLLYQLIPVLQLRAGYSWPQAAGFAGVGWRQGAVDCHFIFHLHPQLGLSPALGVQYRFKRKES